MRRVSFAAVPTVVFCVLLLAACGQLVTSLDDIAKVSNYLAFDPDLARSGDPYESKVTITFLRRPVKGRSPHPTDTPAERHRLLALAKSDDQALASAIQNCVPELKELVKEKESRMLIPTDPTGVIIAFGQLLFDKVIDEFKSRITAIKQASSADYNARAIWVGNPEWKEISCIVIRRELTKEGLEAAAKDLRSQNRSPVVDPVRMTVVLQIQHYSAAKYSGYTVSPIYLRVDHAKAQTAKADGGKDPEVRVQVSLLLTTIVQDRNQKTKAVNEAIIVQLAAIKAPLGKAAKVCPFLKRDGGYLQFQSCAHTTKLLAEPNLGTAKQLLVAISEAGSALADAEAAVNALDNLKKAAQPSVTEILKEVAAHATK